MNEHYFPEFEVNDALDHRNLEKIIKTFPIQNVTLHVIIMPFFPQMLRICSLNRIQYQWTPLKELHEMALMLYVTCMKNASALHI